jgi:hypothetical protein
VERHAVSDRVQHHHRVEGAHPRQGEAL